MWGKKTSAILHERRRQIVKITISELLYDIPHDPHGPLERVKLF